MSQQKQGKHLSILMYHHFGKATEQDQNAEFFIDDETFSQQLDVLKKQYHPVSLSEVEQAFFNKQKLPKNVVLLTIDDGYLDNYTQAYPLILKYEVPVVIFLSTGQVGAEKNMLNWDMVKEMQASGFVEFASHGVNHRKLRTISDEDILFELKNSKETLEQRLGQSIVSFCYPYGAFDKRVRNLVLQSGYRLDFGTRKGLNTWPWNERKPLLRSHIMRDESIRDFHRQLKTGYKKGLASWF